MTPIQYGLFLLGRRDYGVEELRGKCLKHYARDDDRLSEIEALLERLAELGYLDDQKFAAGYVRREVNRYQGPSKIRWALRQKGIESQLIEHALEDIDWFKACEQALESRLHRLDLTDTDKIYRFLAGRGFSREQIQDSLSTARQNAVEE